MIFAYVAILGLLWAVLGVIVWESNRFSPMPATSAPSRPAVAPSIPAQCRDTKLVSLRNAGILYKIGDALLNINNQMTKDDIEVVEIYKVLSLKSKAIVISYIEDLLMEEVKARVDGIRSLSHSAERQAEVGAEAEVAWDRIRESEYLEMNNLG